MLNSLPVGKLVITWKDGPQEQEYSWIYPIYEEFSETIALLQDQGIYTNTEEKGVLSGDQLTSVSITCYNLQEDDVEYDANGSRSVTYSPEREVTQTYTQPDELEQIAPALFPDNLRDVAGDGITGKLWNDNFEVSVVFAPDEHFSESYLYFIVLEERLPSFVLEETKKTG